METIKLTTVALDDVRLSTQDERVLPAYLLSVATMYQCFLRQNAPAINQANLDALAYGAGVVSIGGDGTLQHVPIAEWNHEGADT